MAPAPDEWIALSTEPLDAKAAIDFVAAPRAGGIDVFLGITRAHRDPVRGELVALEYDAYPEMAQRQIAAMIRQARTQWPICKCAILHRTGRVDLGQASVVIAVSCPHRAEAFAACRFLIDTLKGEAAIWKKDIYPAGEAWHHEPHGPPAA